MRSAASWTPVRSLLHDIERALSLEALAFAGLPDRRILDAQEALELLVHQGNLLACLERLRSHLRDRE